MGKKDIADSLVVAAAQPCNPSCTSLAKAGTEQISNNSPAYHFHHIWTCLPHTGYWQGAKFQAYVEPICAGDVSAI